MSEPVLQQILSQLGQPPTSQIVSPTGRPVSSEAPDEACGRCGSTKFETVSGLGGYWTQSCAKCHAVHREGRTR